MELSEQLSKELSEELSEELSKSLGEDFPSSVAALFSNVCGKQKHFKGLNQRDIKF